MQTLNEVTLAGHIGRVDNKQIGGGDTTITNLSIATQRGRKNPQTGEWTNETDWHRVTVWGISPKLLPLIEKGAKVLVKGRLQTRSWDGPDGAKRYATEVVVNSAGLMLLSAATQKGQNSYAGQGTAQHAPAQAQHTPANPPGRNQFPGAGAEEDDPIPF